MPQLGARRQKPVSRRTALDQNITKEQLRQNARRIVKANPSFGTRVKKILSAESPLMKTLDFISRPAYAIKGSIQAQAEENPLPVIASLPTSGGLSAIPIGLTGLLTSKKARQYAGKGIRGEKKYSGSDIVATLAPQMKNKLVRGGSGFALDVMSDPLTFLSLGAAGGGKSVAKVGIEEVATKTLGETVSKSLVAPVIKRGVERGASHSTILKRIGQLPAEQKELLLKELPNRFKGGVGVQLPFVAKSRAVVIPGTATSKVTAPIAENILALPGVDRSLQAISAGRRAAASGLPGIQGIRILKEEGRRGAEKIRGVRSTLNTALSHKDYRGAEGLDRLMDHLLDPTQSSNVVIKELRTHLDLIQKTLRESGDDIGYLDNFIPRLLGEGGMRLKYGTVKAAGTIGRQTKLNKKYLERVLEEADPRKANQYMEELYGVKNFFSENPVDLINNYATAAYKRLSAKESARRMLEAGTIRHDFDVFDGISLHTTKVAGFERVDDAVRTVARKTYREDLLDQPLEELAARKNQAAEIHSQVLRAKGAKPKDLEAVTKKLEEATNTFNLATLKKQSPEEFSALRAAADEAVEKLTQKSGRRIDKLMVGHKGTGGLALTWARKYQHQENLTKAYEDLTKIGEAARQIDVSRQNIRTNLGKIGARRSAIKAEETAVQIYNREMRALNRTVKDIKSEISALKKSLKHPSRSKQLAAANLRLKAAVQATTKKQDKLGAKLLYAKPTKIIETLATQEAGLKQELVSLAKQEAQLKTSLVGRGGSGGLRRRISLEEQALQGWEKRQLGIVSEIEQLKQGVNPRTGEEWPVPKVIKDLMGTTTLREGIERNSTTWRTIRGTTNTFLNGKWAPTPFADEFERAFAYRPKSDLIEHWEKAVGLFKTYVTLPFPGFYVKNLLGGMYNNFLGGVATKHYRHTVAILTASDDDLLKMSFGGAYKTTEGKVLNGLELKGLLREKGIVSDTDLYLLEQVSNKVGITPVSRFIRQQGGNKMRQSENFLRSASFLKGYEEFKGLDEAAREFTMVRHGDYGDLTRTEERIKHIMPFYKWTRFNVPLQIQSLMEVPGRATRVQAFINNLLEDPGEREKFNETGFPSKFLQDRGTFLASGPLIPKALQKALGGPQTQIGLDLPIADINQANPIGLAGQTAFSGLIEAITNVNLQTGNPLKRVLLPKTHFFLKPFAKVPGLNQFFSVTPGGELMVEQRVLRALGTANPASRFNSLIGQIAPQDTLPGTPNPLKEVPPWIRTSGSLLGTRISPRTALGDKLGGLRTQKELDKLVEQLYREGYGPAYQATKRKRIPRRRVRTAL